MGAYGRTRKCSKGRPRLGWKIHRDPQGAGEAGWDERGVPVRAEEKGAPTSLSACSCSNTGWITARL